MIKECKKHGLVKYSAYKNGNNVRYRCSKCVTDAVNKRRRKLKILALEYKGGKCIICGYSRCIRALEFHHIDSKEKDFGIGETGATRSWNEIKDELDKCILVCSNCHAEIHEGLINLNTPP